MAIERNIAVGQRCPLPGIGTGDSRPAERTTDRIYLDLNASTPLAPEVVAAMTPYLTQEFGNPSSTHWAGAAASDAVEAARLKMAMGVKERAGLGAIRFSLGRTTTLAEGERVVELLTKIVR